MSANEEALNELYQELIVDHYKHPRCREPMENPSSSASLLNPLCGDEIKIYFRVTDNRVDRASFEGKGCSISQASASMMCELLTGKSEAEARELISSFAGMMREEQPAEELEKLGDAASLQGVKRFAARIRCAMLGWEAAKISLDKLKPEQNGN